MKAAKVLSLILGVLFLAGCASTACKSKKAEVVAPVAAAVVAPVKPVAIPEPAPAQEEPAMEKIPAAVRK